MRYRVNDMKTYTHSNLLEQGYKCTNIRSNRQYIKNVSENVYILINFEDNKGIFMFILAPIPIHRYKRYIKGEDTTKNIETELEWLLANKIIRKTLI